MPTAPRTVDVKGYNFRRILVLDQPRYEAEMRRHGADTDDQVATFLEMDRSTIRRIRKGEMLPSNGFLAACVDAGVDHMKFLAVEHRTPRATASRAA